MRDQGTMKKWVNFIENLGEKWYKMLQNCQMTDLGETLKQLFNQH